VPIDHPFADPELTADIGRHRPAVDLAQRVGDLLFVYDQRFVGST
jgi:hypothetical protein